MPTLDATGLTIDRLADIRARLEDALKAAFGAAINLDPDGVLGKVVGIFSAALSSIEEGIQQAYDASDLNNAEGVQLDNLAQIIGLRGREPATPSHILSMELTGTPATVVPVGTLFSRGSGGPQFELDADVTIGMLGTGLGTATAVEGGPTEAAIGEVEVIVTAVAGLDSVTNLTAAVVGRARETDTELRLRIRASGSIIGSATVEAIRARVRDLDSIEEALVVENETDATVDGQPPHSIHVIIWPAVAGDDQDLLVTTIFDEKAAGIATHGGVAVTHTDSMDIDHTVRYSVAVQRNIVFQVTLVRNDDYPADGDERVATEIETYVNGSATEPPLSVGQDVSHVALVARIFGAVSGIDDMTLLIGLDPGPPVAEDPFVILPTEIARILDPATDIVVVP